MADYDTFMTKEENELYGGSFPQAGKDHHQDLYEHNLKYNEAEYHAQELLLQEEEEMYGCLLYTSPSPRDAHESRMPSSA